MGKPAQMSDPPSALGGRTPWVKNRIAMTTQPLVCHSVQCVASVVSWAASPNFPGCRTCYFCPLWLSFHSRQRYSLGLRSKPRFPAPSTTAVPPAPLSSEAAGDRWLRLCCGTDRACSSRQEYWSGVPLPSPKEVL